MKPNWKHSSGYHPGELLQSGEAEQLSNSATREHYKDNPQEEQPQDLIVRFTRVETKEKMLRAAREKGWVTHKGKPIRFTAHLSTETLQTLRELGQYSTSLKKRIFKPEFHIQPN